MKERFYRNKIQRFRERRGWSCDTSSDGDDETSLKDSSLIELISFLSHCNEEFWSFKYVVFNWEKLQTQNIKVERFGESVGGDDWPVDYVDDDIDKVMRQISLAVSRSRGVSSLSRAVSKEWISELFLWRRHFNLIVISSESSDMYTSNYRLMKSIPTLLWLCPRPCHGRSSKDWKVQRRLISTARWIIMRIQINSRKAECFFSES